MVLTREHEELGKNGRTSGSGEGVKRCEMKQLASLGLDSYNSCMYNDHDHHHQTYNKKHYEAASPPPPPPSYRISSYSTTQLLLHQFYSLILCYIVRCWWRWYGTTNFPAKVRIKVKALTLASFGLQHGIALQE